MRKAGEIDWTECIRIVARERGLSTADAVLLVQQTASMLLGDRTTAHRNRPSEIVRVLCRMDQVKAEKARRRAAAALSTKSNDAADPAPRVVLGVDRGAL